MYEMCIRDSDIRSAVIYGILAVLFYAAGMLPRIDSEILRLGYRTVLLLSLIHIFFSLDKMQKLGIKVPLV